MTNEKKCIYIIEDDATINHGIELTLGNEKYEYRQFYSLGEVEDTEQADLIILDINLLKVFDNVKVDDYTVVTGWEWI